MRTKPIESRSTADRRRIAESTPIDTPRTIQIVAAPTNEEQRARRTLLYLAQHRDAADVGVTEARPPVLVARRDVLHVEPVLLVPRLVEAQAIPDQRKRLGRRVTFRRTAAPGLRRA